MFTGSTALKARLETGKYDMADMRLARNDTVQSRDIARHSRISSGLAGCIATNLSQTAPGVSHVVRIIQLLRTEPETQHARIHVGNIRNIRIIIDSDHIQSHSSANELFALCLIGIYLLETNMIYASNLLY